MCIYSWGLILNNFHSEYPISIAACSQSIIELPDVTQTVAITVCTRQSYGRIWSMLYFTSIGKLLNCYYLYFLHPFELCAWRVPESNWTGCLVTLVTCCTITSNASVVQRLWENCHVFLVSGAVIWILHGFRPMSQCFIMEIISCPRGSFPFSSLSNNILHGHGDCCGHSFLRFIYLISPTYLIIIIPLRPELLSVSMGLQVVHGCLLLLILKLYSG